MHHCCIKLHEFYSQASPFWLNPLLPQSSSSFSFLLFRSDPKYLFYLPLLFFGTKSVLVRVCCLCLQMGSRLIRQQQRGFPKPLMLKDYLLEDMSSCSSDGFKSFPRRRHRCSSTVRFLVELDRDTKRKKKCRNFDGIQMAPRPLQTPAKSAALAALRSIISAVKRLPFASDVSPANKNLGRSIFLPRNLSRKILDIGSFWKGKSSSSSRQEMGQWKSFEQLLKEDSLASGISDSCATKAAATAGDGGGNSMSDERERGNVVVNLDSPGPRNDAVAVAVAVGLLKNGDVSTDSTTRSNASSLTTTDAGTQNKEQFSPVSVLDCPFPDDDEVSSPYHQHGLDFPEGGTHTNLTRKMNRLGWLDRLEPVSLSEQFAPPSRDVNYRDPTYESSFSKDMLEEAEDWAHGRKPSELFLDWEVPRNRVAYVEAMEKMDGWRSFDRENDEVASELEARVLDGLVNEVLVDISYGLKA